MLSVQYILTLIIFWAFGIGISSNLYLTTYYDISKWWVALVISDDDGQCKDTIETVYIKDNLNYANEWVPHYDILTDANGQQFYEWDMISGNIFSLPLSIQITNSSQSVSKYDLITTFDANTQFNFGDDFCLAEVTTSDPTKEPTSSPTSSGMHHPQSLMLITNRILDKTQQVIRHQILVLYLLSIQPLGRECSPMSLTQMN